MTAAGPTAYPANWRPAGAPLPDVPPNTEALAMCIDAYIAALTPQEFDALVARTKNGGQMPNQPPAQYHQQPAQPVQYGR
jgi:hypothetical protein